jgi:hypothetical protein
VTGRFLATGSRDILLITTRSAKGNVRELIPSQLETDMSQRNYVVGYNARHKWPFGHQLLRRAAVHVVHDDVVAPVFVEEDIVDLGDARSGAVELSEFRELPLRARFLEKSPVAILDKEIGLEIEECDVVGIVPVFPEATLSRDGSEIRGHVARIAGKQDGRDTERRVDAHQPDRW